MAGLHSDIKAQISAKLQSLDTKEKLLTAAAEIEAAVRPKNAAAALMSVDHTPSTESDRIREMQRDICRNPFVSALLYVCSLFAMTPPDVLDTRPHLSGTIEGADTVFLVDTGSAISCISEEKYRSIPGHWAMEKAPPDHGLRLSSASGHPS